MISRDFCTDREAARQLINTIFAWSFATLLPFGMVGEFARLICRLVEIELREMLGEADLPRLPRPRNNIIL